MAAAATASATASGRIDVIHLPCRRRLVGHEDRSTGPEVLLLAERLDGGRQRDEIGAGLGIDQRPLEVPLASVDQCGQRRGCPGSNRTR